MSRAVKKGEMAQALAFLIRVTEVRTWVKTTDYATLQKKIFLILACYACL